MGRRFKSDRGYMNNVEKWTEPARESDVWLVFYKIKVDGKKIQEGARYLRLPYVKVDVSVRHDSPEDVAQVPNLSIAQVKLSSEVAMPGDVTITNIVRV